MPTGNQGHESVLVFRTRLGELALFEWPDNDVERDGQDGRTGLILFENGKLTPLCTRDRHSMPDVLTTFPSYVATLDERAN